MRHPTGVADRAHDLLRRRLVAVRVHIHEVARGAEPPADGGAERAAAAGDQRPHLRSAHVDELKSTTRARGFEASSSTVARPRIKGEPAQPSSNW